MLKRIISLLFIFLCVNSLFSKPSVEKINETKPELKTAESVNYDVKRNRLYVSCINERNKSDGYISIINKKGEIIEKKWIDGLNDPKGATISGDSLYVSDIDEVVVIDIEAAEIVDSYKIEESEFLNDVASLNGNIFISDFSPDNSAIYKISNGEVEKLLEGKEISRPNGLCVDEENIYIGNSNGGDATIKKVNLKNVNLKNIEKTGTNGIDGLKLIDNSTFIISNWAGKTKLINTEGDNYILLDTSDDDINSADLEYIDQDNLILIPTFHANTVSVYELNR